jgi:hypothetical protein
LEERGKGRKKRGGWRDGMGKGILKALDKEYMGEGQKKLLHLFFGRGVDRDGIGRLR